MFIKSFFKLFPPPTYINMPYAGLDISDEAIRCIEYSTGKYGYKIHKYASRILKPGIVEAGNIKDEKALSEEIKALVDELKISLVKVSLPEEKMYLFKTEVPNTNTEQIRRNIEFKLEENVPMPASEAIFFFDRLPAIREGQDTGKVFASVSVAPRELVNQYLKILHGAGLTVISFEIQAKAIARAVVPQESHGSQMIVHVMNKKTGLYIVYNGVVCFTSTIAWGGESIKGKTNEEMSDGIYFLRREIEKVYNYWHDHGDNSALQSIIISGHDAVAISQVSHLSPNSEIQVNVANVWQNVFLGDHYIPSITHEDSLDYSVAVGLALQ